jgi:hypothetical protein
MLSALAMPSLGLQAWSAFMSPMGFSAADFTIPKKYLLCEEDLCVVPELQRRMAEQAGAEIVAGPFGHAPFMRDDGLDVLMGLIGDLADR